MRFVGRSHLPAAAFNSFVIAMETASGGEVRSQSSCDCPPSLVEFWPSLAPRQVTVSIKKSLGVEPSLNPPRTELSCRLGKQNSSSCEIHYDNLVAGESWPASA